MVLHTRAWKDKSPQDDRQRAQGSLERLDAKFGGIYGFVVVIHGSIGFLRSRASPEQSIFSAQTLGKATLLLLLAMSVAWVVRPSA